jgi:hypothetical protein
MEILDETMEAGAGGESSIESNAPENVLSIKERILQRRLRNRRLLQEGKEIPDDEISAREEPTVRYQVQRWINGDDGKETEYEAWRREKVDKGRENRLKQEKEDRIRGAKYNNSTYERNMSHIGELDNQIDTFLADYIENYEN